MSEEEEDTIEVEERGLFPLLLSDKDTETGETKHYYVKIGEYNKNLFNSVDVMDDDELDALRLKINKRKKALRDGKK